MDVPESDPQLKQIHPETNRAAQQVSYSGRRKYILHRKCIPRANLTTFEALKIFLCNFFQLKIKIGVVIDNEQKFHSSSMIFCTCKNPLEKTIFILRSKF